MSNNIPCYGVPAYGFPALNLEELANTIHYCPSTVEALSHQHPELNMLPPVQQPPLSIDTSPRSGHNILSHPNPLHPPSRYSYLPFPYRHTNPSPFIISTPPRMAPLRPHIVPHAHVLEEAPQSAMTLTASISMNSSIPPANNHFNTDTQFASPSSGLSPPSGASSKVPLTGAERISRRSTAVGAPEPSPVPVVSQRAPDRVDLMDPFI